MLNIFEIVILNSVRSFVCFLFVHIQMVNNQLMLIEVTIFFSRSTFGRGQHSVCHEGVQFTKFVKK